MTRDELGFLVRQEYTRWAENFPGEAPLCPQLPWSLACCIGEAVALSAIIDEDRHRAAVRAQRGEGFA